jgi:hypothetical protein
LAASVVIAVIVIYVAAFHDPPADDSKEALISRVDGPQGEAEATANEAEPAIEPPKVADPGRELLKDRQYASKNPLYFRVVFGREGTTSTLGVLDESSGTGTGYNVAYVDENRNDDLTDDAAKKFAKIERGSRTGQTDPSFNFSGPLSKGGKSAKYTLNLYALGRRAPATPGEHYFFWTLDTDAWNYFFINGRMRLSSSAADALAGPAVCFGGDCKWEITSRPKNGKATVSAGLKDENGCTLRLVRLSRKTLSPRLSLAKNGKIEFEEDMKFG